jgi:carboxymethylenebutenolidase
MTELQKYLAEEIAEDLADGIITRREAVRRLGLMGLTGAAASALLAAGAAPAVARKRSHRRRSTETTWDPADHQSITFAGPRGTLMASWAPAAKARGAVLVIHENRGLTPHISRVASRFAASGWSALALDLLSEEGGTGSFEGDEGAIAARLSEISASTPQRFDEDMKAGISELKRRVRGRPMAAIGFCFGGGMVWRLLAAREKRLDAAAPFYGPFPEGGSLKGIRADVLGVYAGMDDRVNATRDAAQAALEAARLRHEILTFAEAGHAFFNDTGARFDPHASAEAWRRTLNWFGEAGDHDHDRH